MTDDFYENVQNGCENMTELNSTTTRDELYEIVDDQPCVSAVALG